MHFPADLRPTRGPCQGPLRQKPLSLAAVGVRIWRGALLLAATMTMASTIHAAAQPWARAELLAQDASRWPEVALVLRITDVDSYAGDSKSHDTSLPNPLNPFDCRAADRPARECWRVTMKMGGQDLQVLTQQTVPDLDSLRVQYLWLVYRSNGEPGAQAPLDLSLASVMRNSVISPVPLKAGSARLDPQQAPKADLAASPWTYLLPIAEKRMREAEDALPAWRERTALREQSASFTERECQFQTSAGIMDAQTCHYLRILAQLEALRQASSGSGK